MSCHTEGEGGGGKTISPSVTWEGCGLKSAKKVLVMLPAK
jgi:hypothetical protein